MTGEDQVAQELLMKGIANDLLNEIVKACPVDNGFLKNSIKIRVEKNKLVISMLPYGEHVEYGTNPHTIRPKDKKALAFSVDGKKIIRKSVQHPGTRPNPFVRKTIHQTLPKIIAENIERFA
ncbi:hypothetical protein K9M79_03070 [Candidatus Woesearchaeota archaeon]|nr:hypothetical protein [Candidatus Woesearchaeota archaeon]